MFLKKKIKTSQNTKCHFSFITHSSFSRYLIPLTKDEDTQLHHTGRRSTPIIVNVIKDMYINIIAMVISPDGKTELFEIKAGVLWGDTHLFIIALEYTLWIAVESRKEEPGFQLSLRRRRE